jgi:CubicO group peptidase (beta-lactamase class C family)
MLLIDHTPDRRQFLSGALLTGCAGMMGKAFAETQDASPSPNALEKQLDDYLTPYVEMKDFSGTVLLSRAGKIVASRTYGLANYELQVPHRPSTKYRICSVGKMFTEAAVLLLEQQGKLSTRDALSKFIADYPKGDKITLGQLLEHRAGIARDLVNFDHERALPHTPAELVAFVKKIPPIAEPGVQYAYSNNGYRLLAYVIEQAAGQSYGRFVEEALLAPRNMRDTHEERTGELVPDRATGYLPGPGYGTLAHPAFLDLSNYAGAGSFYSTVADLHTWARSLRSPAADKPGPGAGAAKDGKAPRRRLGHDGLGHGFMCLVYRYPDEDACLILAGNIESGPFGLLHQDLPAILFGDPYQKPVKRSSAVALDEASARRFIGHYEIGPGRTLEIRRQDKALLVGAGDGFSMLIPQSKTEYFFRLKYATIRFEAKDGQVTGLHWLENGMTFWCRKVP